VDAAQETSISYRALNKKKPDTQKGVELSLREGAGVSAGIHLSI
jgi:hypothetical protein